MTEENKILYNKILKNSKTLVAYYPYPTASMGSPIAETDNHNSDFNNQELRNIVDLMVNLGSCVAGLRPTNKIAIEVRVEGLDFPVFFCSKDNRFTICKEIKQKDNIEPIKILWFLVS